MARVYAPVIGYEGVSASVVFRDGMGETDSPELIRWFKNKGYRVEEDSPRTRSKKEE